MRLAIDLQPSTITFDSTGSRGPYPLLVEVGSLHIAARAGDEGTGEPPSVQVSLDNSGNRAAALLGVPLRRRATLYTDDGSVFFEGIVSQMALGTLIQMTIET